MFCKSLMTSNIILRHVQMNSFDDNKYAVKIDPNEEIDMFCTNYMLTNIYSQMHPNEEFHMFCLI